MQPGPNGLTCLPKHGGTRHRRFLVTHPMTDHCESCLTSKIAANHLRHRAPRTYSSYKNYVEPCHWLKKCKKPNNSIDIYESLNTTREPSNSVGPIIEVVPVDGQNHPLRVCWCFRINTVAWVHFGL
ncbi:hypothetical protein evm_006174 [Chilo suppressalis]|nr:hypothetical protein evm_006174 [Chilo suppressalis]